MPEPFKDDVSVKSFIFLMRKELKCGKDMFLY